jgi:uncharacterized repeat protein (TIGR03803 family)
MSFLSSRLAIIPALLFAALVPARGAVPPVPPVFLTGTGGPYPDYTQQSLKTLPVGKTLVVPIVVSGSGPISYSASSSSSSLVPIIKTGYPVMNIQVSYSGTTTVSGSINTLYTFTGGNDGGNPQAGVIQASNGNLYGTTMADRTNKFGTVYEIGTSSTTLDTLYSFTGGTDGGHPYAPLYQTSGSNLYGTTSGTGGTNGFGTVYQITTTGSLTTLYSFTGAADGGNPQAGVVTMGTGGILYGTTTIGGGGGGTIFQITATGTNPAFGTLYSFTGGSDGGNPQGSLFASSDGNLYGATADGGASGSGTNGFGTIFKIPAAGGSLTTLYSFTGGNDGAHPYGGVIQTADGAIYGTTASSGTYGYGTVFKLTTSGTLIPLHSFSGGSDGGNPYGGLISGTDGKLYGTTESSGTNIKGTIFQVNVGGGFQTLYAFTGGSDGGNPYAGVIQASSGNFYGTTYAGGSGSGVGTIYELPAKFAPSFSGTMTFALLRDMAPTTCSYIAGFAQAGYYTNCQFFRIANLSSTGLPGFIAQGGDPTNTGTGNPGFSFDDELNPSLIFTGAGQLAMANSGVNTTTYHGTNGSQFFITDYNQESLRSLDFNYTIFGQLLTGFDTMQKVMAVTTGTNGETPTVPVVMNSVTVTEDSTDAVMLVNAAGSVPNGATITVNATDPGGHKAVTPSTTGTTTTIGQTHSIGTFADNVNDPPFILPDDDVYASLHQKVTFPITARDLEFDYLISGASVISGSAGTVSVSGNVATVTPVASSPIGNVTAAFYVYEPFLSSNGQHYGTASAGLGTGKLTPLPALFKSTAGSPLSSSTSSIPVTPAIGSFLCSNPSATVGDFSATINWGDGSTISGTDTVSVVKSSYLPTTYSITPNTDHVYQNPGIYPVVATVTDTYGNVLQVQNTAVVSGSSIYTYGRTFTAAKGAFNGMVATFVDSKNSAPASTYHAVINWGDGVVGTGTIAGSNASFQVYGAHKYTAGTTYPVDVTITSLADPTQSGYAWSIAKLTGVPTHQPPFAQSHIVGELGNPGFGSGYLDEEVTLFNSGNLASGPITLEFYLSPTTSLGSSAILLQVGKGTTYNTVSIPAGNAISGAVSDIIVPAGVTSRGKYLIMKVITSDPIGSYMDYPRTFADPNPLIE